MGIKWIASERRWQTWTSLHLRVYVVCVCVLKRSDKHFSWHRWNSYWLKKAIDLSHVHPSVSSVAVPYWFFIWNTFDFLQLGVKCLWNKTITRTFFWYAPVTAHCTAAPTSIFLLNRPESLNAPKNPDNLYNLQVDRSAYTSKATKLHRLLDK